MGKNQDDEVVNMGFDRKVVPTLMDRKDIEVIDAYVHKHNQMLRDTKSRDPKLSRQTIIRLAVKEYVRQMKMGS